MIFGMEITLELCLAYLFSMILWVAIVDELDIKVDWFLYSEDTNWAFIKVVCTLVAPLSIFVLFTYRSLRYILGGLKEFIAK